MHHIVVQYWLKDIFWFVRGRFLIKYWEVLKVWYYDIQSSKLNKVLFTSFREICRIQIKIYSQTFIAPKYDALYSNNKVRGQTLSLALWLQLQLVQLNWRVASPCIRKTLKEVRCVCWSQNGCPNVNWKLGSGAGLDWTGLDWRVHKLWIHQGWAQIF